MLNRKQTVRTGCCIFYDMCIVVTELTVFDLQKPDSEDGSVYGRPSQSATFDDFRTIDERYEQHRYKGAGASAGDDGDDDNDPTTAPLQRHAHYRQSRPPPPPYNVISRYDPEF